MALKAKWQVHKTESLMMDLKVLECLQSLYPSGRIQSYRSCLHLVFQQVRLVFRWVDQQSWSEGWQEAECLVCKSHKDVVFGSPVLEPVKDRD